MARRRWLSLLAAMSAFATVTGCSSLGAAGPSGRDIRGAGSSTEFAESIAVVEIDRQVTDALGVYSKARSFSEVLGNTDSFEPRLETGDIVEVTLWEAPPAVLFGALVGSSDLMADPSIAQTTTLPQQFVTAQGTITVPFVGQLRVAGMTPEQVQAAIVARLDGRAHDPQAMVRIVGGDARTVAVLGDVNVAMLVPLGARGERLLDALAKAGGTRQEASKTVVQITRGETVAAMPLAKVLSDPQQNVKLQADDILSVAFQPYSFVALGAVTRNAEIPFEGSGLSLAEALGRTGGLRDDRADIRGVFVFRLEDAGALPAARTEGVRATTEGATPVVYRLDLSDADGLFLAQDFAVRNDDVIYVSTAPGADLQRFLSTVSSAAFSSIAIGNALK